MLTGALFTGCKQTGTEPANKPETTAAAKTDAPVGKIETASFTIDGMTCAIGCAKTIESKLASMDGVKTASVDFEKKTATVEFDSARQSPQKLATAVEAVAGGNTYKVSNIKSSGDHAMLIDKEKKKNKKTRKDKTAKKDGCSSEAKDGKTGCCSAKKACHGEKATM